MNVPHLSPYGPHSPAYTRQVGETFAEAVRVLNHATRGKAGLVYPADVYDLLGYLSAGAGGLDQTARQLSQFLNEELRTDRLAVATGPYAGNPGGAVAAADRYLSAARTAAHHLAAALDHAQQAISAVSAEADDNQA